MCNSSAGRRAKDREKRDAGQLDRRIGGPGFARSGCHPGTIAPAADLAGVDPDPRRFADEVSFGGGGNWVRIPRFHG